MWWSKSTLWYKNIINYYVICFDLYFLYIFHGTDYSQYDKQFSVEIDGKKNIFQIESI
jgi:hypothetical protein